MRPVPSLPAKSAPLEAAPSPIRCSALIVAGEAVAVAGDGGCSLGIHQVFGETHGPINDLVLGASVGGWGGGGVRRLRLLTTNLGIDFDDSSVRLEEFKLR